MNVIDIIVVAVIAVITFFIVEMLAAQAGYLQALWLRKRFVATVERGVAPSLAEGRS